MRLINATLSFCQNGVRLHNPSTVMWMSQDPMAEDYYPIGPYVYCTGNPVNVVDPDGRSTLVKRLENGTYEVVDVIQDEKCDIYVAKQNNEGLWEATEESIGMTPSPYSFVGNDNATPMIGAIIDPNDFSGICFIDDMTNNLRPLGYYMDNARNKHKYDFKVTNGSKSAPSSPFAHYRGMPLRQTMNGKPIYASARDVGNIVAGYYAAAYGITWDEARISFDHYNGCPEPHVTQGAQLFGYRLGTRLPYNERIRRRNYYCGLIELSNVFFQ